MKPAMYIFINKGLGMSSGKMAAQAAHAAVEAYNLSLGDDYQDLVAEWYKGGHYMKLIMEGRDELHMRNIADYLEARNFPHAVIIDEGRTEVPALSLTAIGVALVDKDDEHTKATFSSFSLYKDPKPEPAPIYGDSTEPYIGVPETPEFKDRYSDEKVSSQRVPGADGGQIRRPKPTDFITGGQFFERYLNDPDNIVRDVDTARKLFGDLTKKPR